MFQSVIEYIIDKDKGKPSSFPLPPTSQLSSNGTLAGWTEWVDSVPGSGKVISKCTELSAIPL
jgi:hypothetical protein